MIDVIVNLLVVILVLALAGGVLSQSIRVVRE